MSKRNSVRRVTRNPIRPTVRHCTRLLHGATRPNYLLRALNAFSRAIRAQRRLMKLAPRFFDSAVVNRETLARHAELQYRREWEPLLNKAYGLPPDATEPVLEPHWYPSVPKSQRAILAIEYELASWQVWMNTGREAMNAFQQRRPHALVSFTHLARLLEIGFAFASLATGVFSPWTTERK